MLKFTDKGIYCKQADLYIDPWKPVKNAIITHGHSDHARSGMNNYLCHTETMPILRLRLGADINVQSLPYNQEISINGVKISLHPAGHIIGSAQVRLEYKGEIWVVSGDYKLIPDGLSVPFEPVKCHHFITESTFGLPIYNFPSTEEVYASINQWWKQNAAEGFNSVIIAYALGKSQSILHHLDQEIGDIFLHGAVANVNNAFNENGHNFPGTWVSPEMDRKAIKGAMIVTPSSALSTPWIRKFSPSRAALCSGWMQLRGARRRSGVDRGFVLSDHCDWSQLNEAVLATGAENIYVTHGYQTTYAKWLCDRYQLNAIEIKTQFEPATGDLD
ncbi:putative mRNA 3-end processing factor [Algoriphagus ratkowskyi]|uniref:Ligase-associated DNA damage response exonuclease n=1 Tax=Algoriphagus ratkowskyi TaxID=57028 RepID=A0A2W7SX23_9BACT|nr:ligase-associated DNA damage response exonuclease [Algoriphagus ratkowskyi]PZX55362.1 putative mRNA 3-end processing factor [Algoriphagus ratkowskyi]TXD79707.1 ligase-associated DNA damage response exonuclease [Algoriphagus ratkowskyi]